MVGPENTGVWCIAGVYQFATRALHTGDFQAVVV